MIRSSIRENKYAAPPLKGGASGAAGCYQGSGRGNNAVIFFRAEGVTSGR